MEPDLDRLIEAELRTSSSYEVVLFDRLPPAERAALRELADDPGFYGVLRPAEGSERTVKAIGRDAALLLFTLLEPGRLPRYAREGGGGALLRQVAELIGDGVLEMRRDGEFRSGPEALATLTTGSAETVGSGRLAELSAEALRFAAAMPTTDAGKLAGHLYAFNRVPLSPRWARLAGPADVLEHLGEGGDDPGWTALRRHWRRREADESNGWITWQRHGAGDSEVRGEDPTYKLYLSPEPRDLRQAFEALTTCLHESGAFAFKVGADAAGLLRPDKLVVYFAAFEELASAAHRLVDRLGGLDAQGVPFSAEVGAGAILSWGMDPPRAERILSWSERESWRLFVVHRLAAALAAAKREGSGELPPWRYALERVRLQGIDVERWTPSAALWSAAETA